MIERYYQLSKEALDELSDEAFYDFAARAQYMQKQDVETVKYGVLKALAQAFGSK